MIRLLNDHQKDHYQEFKDFVKEHVEPYAAQWDSDEIIPRSIIELIGKSGYFGCNIPKDYGGWGSDFVTYGLLNEAFGRGSSSLTGLLTIQAMVSLSLVKWGTNEQRSRWLEPIARGEIVAAFALTEPNAGSDVKGLETTFTEKGSSLILNGHKRWISYGEVADLFLVFGKLEDKSLACLVPKSAPGLEVEPIKNMLGFKAAHMAQINFNEVEIPSEDILGKPGFAFSHIVPIGLQYGRISTACSALGLLRACFEESVIYASSRKVSGNRIGDKGMIRSLIARMGTDLQAVSLMCFSACTAEDEHLPESFEKVLMAKYFSSRAVVRAASDAVQIRGASGCNESSAVARYYRDAKIMEIIEGTTQIHESILGKAFVEKVRTIEKEVAS